jgi:thiosulfate dehydrogenase [quinone] large subunit
MRAHADGSLDVEANVPPHAGHPPHPRRPPGPHHASNANDIERTTDEPIRGTSQRGIREVTMFRVTHVTDEKGTVLVQDPPIARFLFQSSTAAWLWLVVRLYLGYQWIEAGWHKFTDPKWLGDGTALLGYWKAAVAVPATPAKAPITYDWYRSFLQTLIDTQSYVWFSKLIVFGELLIGVGLIVGGLVGIAAFFGALMNMSFMLAGTASTNPVLFFLAVLLILAWKNAGYVGLDRFLLPVLGTPWKQSKLSIAPAPQAVPRRA